MTFYILPLYSTASSYTDYSESLPVEACTFSVGAILEMLFPFFSDPETSSEDRFLQFLPLVCRALIGTLLQLGSVIVLTRRFIQIMGGPFSETHLSGIRNATLIRRVKKSACVCELYPTIKYFSVPGESVPLVWNS